MLAQAGRPPRLTATEDGFWSRAPIKSRDIFFFFENAVVWPRRELQPAHGRLQRALASIGQFAQSAEHARGDAGVVVPPRPLDGAGALYPPANLLRGSARAVAAHFLVGHGGHLDVPVDAVQQRPADLAQVALDDAAGAAALAGRVTIESARPPVQITTATHTESSGPPMRNVVKCSNPNSESRDHLYH